MSIQIDTNLLTRYQPLNAINPDNLAQLARQIQSEDIPAGSKLFSKGDKDKFQFFLVEGEIDLSGDSGVLKTIKSGSNDGLTAIAQVIPRTVTATAKTDCIIFRVNANTIDVMLTWDQAGSYQVTELGVDDSDDDDDWMNRLLQTEAFHRIPPANIQAIFTRMESVPVKAGEAIINQGDDGDYFYIIKNGRCLVTRTMPGQDKAIKLAELKEGDTFGEEALISSNKRNATITMLTSGTLNRLSKEDFIELLNEPLLDWVDYEKAQQLIDTDGAVWLDVRLPAEHQTDAINSGMHIPLIFLRMKIDTLSTNSSYVVYCDTGRRSSAAAFLLSERGYTTYILKDGIGSAPAEIRTSQNAA